MSTLAVCRVCLARNKRMHIITNTLLQTTFEALSGSQFLTNDGKPESLCYICFAQLQGCWKFKEMSQKAEELLTHLLCNGIKFAQKNITLLDGKIQQTLSISTTKYASMPEYCDMFIKEESGLQELISVKVPIGGDDLVDTSRQFRISVEINSLKEELNSEFDEGLDTTCLAAYSPNKEFATRVKNEGQNNTTKGKNTFTNPLIIQSSKEKTNVCEICSRSFKHAAYLQRHQKTHMPKSFSCHRCLKTFSTKCDLQTHILLHSEYNLLVCDSCSKAFFSKNSLKNHITRKHMHMNIHTGKKQHVCDRCNKAFNHRGTLRLHMRIHTGDKPYACEHCPKMFSQKGTLRRHIRMHTGEKPYACDRCTKTFNQESSLKRHIKMHTGEKQYTCNRCDKAYYESSHLKRHMRTHTGEKPYACDRCFQTFAQSSNLQTHMKKHTGVKASKYVCHECNKAFDHKSIFKRHLLIHTREKPYPCIHCDKKYADKRTLQRHILTHQ